MNSTKEFVERALDFKLYCSFLSVVSQTGETNLRHGIYMSGHEMVWHQLIFNVVFSSKGCCSQKVHKVHPADFCVCCLQGCGSEYET